MQTLLGKIKSLQNKIEAALKDSDFETLANLSTELQSSVEDLVSNSIYKNKVTESELVDLQNLLSSLEKYQEITSTKFKAYTSKVSRNQKMHQAYKQ
jgi:hypothetical protein|tara:strand:- start:594 stop:884 length:291 start_codon:yes stop_codon:yes gene_type:complete